VDCGVAGGGEADVDGDGVGAGRRVGRRGGGDGHSAGFQGLLAGEEEGHLVADGEPVNVVPEADGLDGEAWRPRPSEGEARVGLAALRRLQGQVGQPDVDDG